MKKSKYLLIAAVALLPAVFFWVAFYLDLSGSDFGSMLLGSLVGDMSWSDFLVGAFLFPLISILFTVCAFKQGEQKSLSLVLMVLAVFLLFLAVAVVLRDYQLTSFI